MNLGVIGRNRSDFVLLLLVALNKLRKRNKCEALPSILSLLYNELIDSIIQGIIFRFYLSYDTNLDFVCMKASRFCDIYQMLFGA